MMVRPASMGPDHPLVVCDWVKSQTTNVSTRFHGSRSPIGCLRLGQVADNQCFDPLPWVPITHWLSVTGSSRRQPMFRPASMGPDHPLVVVTGSSRRQPMFRPASMGPDHPLVVCDWVKSQTTNVLTRFHGSRSPIGCLRLGQVADNQCFDPLPWVPITHWLSVTGSSRRQPMFRPASMGPDHPLVVVTGSSRRQPMFRPASMGPDHPLVVCDWVKSQTTNVSTRFHGSRSPIGCL